MEAVVREPLSVIPCVQGNQQGIPLNLSIRGAGFFAFVAPTWATNERVPCRYEQGDPSRGTGYLHTLRLTLMKADNDERLIQTYPGNAPRAKASTRKPSRRLPQLSALLSVPLGVHSRNFDLASGAEVLRCKSSRSPDTRKF